MGMAKTSRLLPGWTAFRQANYAHGGGHQILNGVSFRTGQRRKGCCSSPVHILALVTQIVPIVDVFFVIVRPLVTARMVWLYTKWKFQCEPSVQPFWPTTVLCWSCRDTKRIATTFMSSSLRRAFWYTNSFRATRALRKIKLVCSSLCPVKPLKSLWWTKTKVHNTNWWPMLETNFICLLIFSKGLFSMSVQRNTSAPFVAGVAKWPRTAD